MRYRQVSLSRHAKSCRRDKLRCLVSGVPKVVPLLLIWPGLRLSRHASVPRSTCNLLSNPLTATRAKSVFHRLRIRFIIFCRSDSGSFTCLHRLQSACNLVPEQEAQALATRNLCVGIKPRLRDSGAVFTPFANIFPRICEVSKARSAVVAGTPRRPLHRFFALIRMTKRLRSHSSHGLINRTPQPSKSRCIRVASVA